MAQLLRDPLCRGRYLSLSGFSSTGPCPTSNTATLYIFQSIRLRIELNLLHDLDSYA